MCLQLAPLGPRVGIIVVGDVAEEEAAFCAMDDQPNIAIDSDGPEPGIFWLMEFVQL